MSAWGEVFLGIIAFASLVTMIMQVSLLIAAGRMARRIQRLADYVELELKPIFEHLNAIARDAARAASAATAQVERIDRLVTDVIQRIEDTLNMLQGVVSGPVRNGAAMFTAVKAIFSVIRDFRGGRNRSRADDEDALFI